MRSSILVEVNVGFHVLICCLSGHWGLFFAAEISPNFKLKCFLAGLSPMKPVVLHEISVDAAAVLAELDPIFCITIRTETTNKSFSSFIVSTVTPAALQGCVLTKWCFTVFGFFF